MFCVGRLATLAVLLLVSGCYSLKQRRELAAPQAGDCAEDSSPDRCSFRLHELPGRSPYTLGVVEFDDQGLTYPVAQLGPFLEGLDQDNEDYEGRLVLVFAHGWFHDARPDDTNLKFFSEMLEQFAAAETNAVAAGVQKKPRRVVGVFLAWRGAAWMTPGLEYLTFWSRKDAAHRIGERQVTDALLQIRQAAYRNASTDHAPNRFVIMGHSFGAALIYSATSQLLTNSLLTSPETGVAPLADAIILLNAAFEAARVHPLLAQALHDGHDRPVVTFLTAKNDRATGWMFPFARWINNVFGSFRDVKNPIRAEEISQRSANARTIGHFSPFLTHDMTVVKSAERSAPDPDTVRLQSKKASPETRADTHRKATQQIGKAQQAYRDASAMTFGQTRLTPRSGLTSEHLSVFNVAVPSEIWSKHGLEQDGERRKYLMSFLMYYIPFTAAGPRLDLHEQARDRSPRAVPAAAPAAAPAPALAPAPATRF